MSIEFHYLLGSDFKISKPRKTKSWLEYICNFHNFFLGDLNFIFCTDLYLYEINCKYLNHKTYTDVITFNYNLGSCIQGDIYISIDRVIANSVEFKQDFEKELRRVMVHGLLHLLGLNDKSKFKKKEMTKKEDFALSVFFS